MSRVITPPDTDFDSKNPSVLVVNATDTDVEILTLFLKQLYTDVDVYLYKGEFEDAGWALTVASAVDKTFKLPANQIQEVIEYLRSLNG